MSRLGDVIGNYRIVRVLGEGGAGMVYEVEHVRLGRKKALKLLHADVPADFVARFFNEARAVNTIRHPNIIDIEDFVTLESGESFTVMDLLVGEDLRKTLKREGRISPARTAAIGRALAEALAAVHAVDIIHRDLKPENVFLETRPGAAGETPKLLDFGIAKFLNETTGLTRADMTMGTPNYMAPEQIIAGKQVGLAADQYSLGMVLYECVTGAPAFAGQARAKVLRAHCYDAPVSPSERRGEPVGEVLESIILRCLVKAPADRFASATARARAFDSTVPVVVPPPRARDASRASTPVSGVPIELRVPTPPSGTPTVAPIPRRAPTPPAGMPVAAVDEGAPIGEPAAAPPVATAPIDDAERRKRRKRRAMQLVPAVALIAVAIAILAWPHGGNAESAQPPPSPPAPPTAPTVRAPAPAPATFALSLVSDPPGATMLVGGKPVGTAPVTITVEMSPAPLAIIARFVDGSETTLTIVPDHPRAQLAFVAPTPPPVTPQKRVQSTVRPKPPTTAKPTGPKDRDATLDPFKKN